MALADAGVPTIAGAHRFTVDDVSRCGPDVRVSAVPVETVVTVAAVAVRVAEPEAAPDSGTSSS
jgi:hypothetical protein